MYQIPRVAVTNYHKLDGVKGASPGDSEVKNPPEMQEMQVSPWAGKTPRRRAWQPTLVLLPGESHGRSSLVGYSPWGCKELNTTEMTEHAHMSGLKQQKFILFCSGGQKSGIKLGAGLVPSEGSEGGSVPHPSPTF